MKKLVWLMILALLVVPAFAASAEFKIGILPSPGYLQAGNFTLVWAGKYSDLVDAWCGMGYGVWEGHTNWAGVWYAGGITLKKLGGIADLKLRWNEDISDIAGTYLVSKPLETYNSDPDSWSGIEVTLNTPVKVSVAVRSELSESPRLVDRVVVRADGTFAPVTFWGLGYVDVLEDNTFTNTTYAVGAKATIPGLPVSVTPFFELASTSMKYVVGVSVTPMTGVTVAGRYYGDDTWRAYLTLSDLVPNTTISAAYYSNEYYYAYVSSTQKVGKLGDLTLWAGVQQDDPTWAFYAKLVTPLPGGVTNTLRVFQNYKDDAEESWFSSTSFTVDTTIGISF